MIYLTSNGLTSKNLKDHFSNNAKGGDAVIITTASVGYKEKDKHIPEIIDILSANGYSTSFYDFEYDEKKDLSRYGLIYILGGNPFYLMNQINLKGIKESILDLEMTNKIIIGASAGSMILTPSIRLVEELDSGLNYNVKLVEMNGLGLVDFQICPHYKRFMNRFYAFEERLNKYESTIDSDLYTIRDGEAIFVKGDLIEIIKLNNTSIETLNE